MANAFLNSDRNSAMDSEVNPTYKTLFAVIFPTVKLWMFVTCLNNWTCNEMFQLTSKQKKTFCINRKTRWVELALGFLQIPTFHFEQSRLASAADVCEQMRRIYSSYWNVLEDRQKLELPPKPEPTPLESCFQKRVFQRWRFQHACRQGDLQGAYGGMSCPMLVGVDCHLQRHPWQLWWSYSLTRSHVIDWFRNCPVVSVVAVVV